MIPFIDIGIVRNSILLSAWGVQAFLVNFKVALKYKLSFLMLSMETNKKSLGVEKIHLYVISIGINGET